MRVLRRPALSVAILSLLSGTGQEFFGVSGTGGMDAAAPHHFGASSVSSSDRQTDLPRPAPMEVDVLEGGATPEVDPTSVAPGGSATGGGAPLHAAPHLLTNTSSLSLQDLPEEARHRVAALLGVDLGPPGDVGAIRIGQGMSTLLERLDVLLGFLTHQAAGFADDAWATVRYEYDSWSELRHSRPRWRLVVAGPNPSLPSLADIFGRRADGFGRLDSSGDSDDGLLRMPRLMREEDNFEDERYAFRRLCELTSVLLDSTMEKSNFGNVASRLWVDGWPSPAPRFGTLPGRLRNPELRWSLRLRSGAQVRIKPWGAHRKKKEYSYWRGKSLAETESGAPFFSRWSSYLEGYANAERTGEVVEFLPPGTFAALPPGRNHQEEGGYLVRFPLPALPWTIEQQETYAGPSPFWQVGEPVREANVSDEQVPRGGWRLTPERATRLPDEQDALLMEVPHSRLYVDVAAHTDANAWGGQTNTNPFETVLSASQPVSFHP